MKKSWYVLVVVLLSHRLWAEDSLFLDVAQPVDREGWYLGGEIGQVRTQMRSAWIDFSAYKNRAMYLGVIGGYYFSEFVGIEMNLLLPFSAEDDVYPDYRYASYAVANVLPVFRMPMNERLSLYLKGGLSMQSYTLQDSITQDDTGIDFSGLGLFGGLGLNYSITPKIALQLGAHYSEAILTHDGETEAKRHVTHSTPYGVTTFTYHGFVQEPEIEAASIWFAFSIYRQF
ncbi:MAG: outer membrane beta-barrel protein [Cellvibrionales bacterium]|nr:outer membrane beta-barrel protein [Cellvibrionales bacterium]